MLAGDRGAFTLLVDRYEADCLRFASRMLGNRHDAEDVLQRASVVMWKRFGTFESGTDFVAWATTIAFYEVKNFQRVTGRSRLDFDDDLMQTLAAERAADWTALSNIVGRAASRA